MSPVALFPTFPGPASSPADSPEKVRDAASQFEALLIGQILRSVRESGGWLGSNDPTADCAMEFAEQQFATLLAQQGGLGLGGLIARGLVRAADPASIPDAAPSTDGASPGGTAPAAAPKSL